MRSGSSCGCCSSLRRQSSFLSPTTCASRLRSRPPAGSSAARQLADLFGWNLKRTLAALRALETRLSVIGQRLHRLHGSSTIRARDGVLSTAESRTLARRQLAKSGLSVREARLLLDVVNGDVGEAWERSASTADRIAAGALMNRGLIRRENSRYVPEPEVLYSLALTDEPPPRRSHRDRPSGTVPTRESKRRPQTRERQSARAQA